MANPNMEYVEDDSIVVIPAGPSVQEEMDKENSFCESLIYFPSMLESHYLSQTTHKQLQDILKENNDLKDTLSKNNEEMRRIFKLLSEFQEEAVKSQSAQKERNNKILREKDALENQLKQSNFESQKVQDDLTNAEKTISGLESRLALLTEDAEKSKRDFSIVTDENKKLETDVEDLKAVKEKLSNQNSTLLDQLAIQSRVFKEQLSSAEQRCTLSSNELQLVNEKLEERESQIRQLENVSSEKEELLGKLESQNADFKEQLSSAEQRCTLRCNELQLVNGELEQSRSQILKLNQEFENVSSQKEGLLEKLERQNAAFEEANQTAQQNIDDLQNQLSALNSQMSVHKSSELEAKGLLDETQKQLSELQAKTAQLEDNNAKLLEALQVVKRMSVPSASEMDFSVVNREEQQDNEIQRLNLIIDQKNEQISSLENAFEDYKKAEAERFCFIQNVNSLSTATGVFEDSRADSVTRLEDSQQEVLGDENSRASVEELKKRVEELEQILDKEKKEKDAEIEVMKQQNSQIQTAWQSYEADQKNKYHEHEVRVTFEKRQHQERIDELIARNISVEEEHQEKNKELISLRKQIEDLKDKGELAALRAQIEEYQNVYARVISEKRAVDATVDQLKHELNDAHSLLQKQESYRSSFNENRELEQEQERQEDQHQEEEQQQQVQPEEENREHQQQPKQEENELQGVHQEPVSLQPTPVEEFRMIHGSNTRHKQFQRPTSNEE